MSSALPSAHLPSTHLPAAPMRWQDGLRYGGMGLPLAFVALPLYVVLPHHYATAFGLPLAWLGTLLLLARLVDAIADPWIGRWADHLLGAGRAQRPRVLGAAALLLCAGFTALFFPPAGLAPAALLAWCGLMLAVTYLSYSVIAVLHQAWGARLGGGEAQRARIVAWREGLGLAGVLIASVLPALAGLAATSAALTIALLCALWLLQRAPQPDASAHAANAAHASHAAPMSLPLRTPAFRTLLRIYLLNGIASAIPATLVLFFIRDRLQAPQFEALFLASYFAAAALSVPLWVRCVARWGLVRTWLASMLLAIAVFAWAATLGAGDVLAFALVCALSGVALGADLTVPSALLAGVIQQAGHSGHAEGAYFGWWNFATKLNLALAAGLALPALQWGGYTPGASSAQALTALSLAYCVLPCVLKGCAAALLWFTGMPAQRSTPPSTPTSAHHAHKAAP